MVPDFKDETTISKFPFSYIKSCAQSDGWLPISFILFVLLFVPFGQVFDYNLDEGFELMRAYLQNQGLLLYQDIWSDQPPLFSQLLRGELWLFGNSIFWARFLILLFASNLLYFFYRTLALFLDKTAALFGALLLLLSRDFLPFSVQVKIDMPALSLGMASLFFLLYGLDKKHERVRYSSLITSGIMLGLAMQTKLYVALLLFVSILYFLLLYIQNYQTPEIRKNILKALLYWSISLLGCSLILVLGFYLWFGTPIVDQLIGSHLRAEEHFADLNFTRLIQTAFKKDSSFWLLSVTGLVCVFSREKWRISFPLLWLIVCLWMFYDHTPLWPHYYLLLAMPMAWVASTFVFWIKQQLLTPSKTREDASLEGGKKQLMRLLTFLSLGLIGFVFFSHVLLTVKVLAKSQHPIQSGGNLLKEEILANVREFSTQTHWLATDRAMFGFRANLKVPPEIAVLSRKRVLTEGFDGEDFLNIIKKYNCEQVLIGRFVDQRFDPPFLADTSLSSYLQDNYMDMTVADQERYTIHHYVLRRLRSDQHESGSSG